MAKRRTYVDANLLIAAWQGDDEMALDAIKVLDDPDRTLVVSEALWLEVMPKALYHKKEDEQAFYRLIFDSAERIPWQVAILEQAKEVAGECGIGAMDAIHVANAIASNVDEFVSGEKPTKPMFRVQQIAMRSLRAPDG